MSVIEINNLHKNYDTNGVVVRAVRGVTLNIEKGEFAALAGPSGSGKTTLLNIIGGLDSPTEGSVVVHDQDLAGMSRKELSLMRLNNIGFIFQAYNLIPVLTAVENVEYILLLQGVEKSERRKTAKKVLEEVGLGDQVDRLPKELSGGQQQRVAVARAIASEPDIVLADEPTANLDQATGASLLNLMKELNVKKGITFLFSTHDQMVMDRAKRLIYLTDGSIKSEEDRTKKRSPVRKGGAKKKTSAKTKKKGK